MAKLTRKTLSVFAGSAANNGQFGSAQAGTKVTSTDPATIQGLAAWAQGWLDAVEGGQNLPALEEFQGVEFVHSYEIAYLLQEGIPEYDAGTTYFTNSIVKAAGTYEIYGSKIDTNLGNALTDAAAWELLGDLSLIGPSRLVAYASDTGAVNAYAVTPSPAISAYTAGQIISLKPANANTGACTLNVNALGAKNIKLTSGANPAANAMLTTGEYLLEYDGTNFVLLNPEAPYIFALNAKTDYGAVGDGTTDDTTAIQNWINAVVAAGQIGYLPKGTYNITGQLNITYDTTGCTFRGDGLSQSLLVFTSAVAAPNLQIKSTTPSNGSNYLDWDGIGIQGNVAGAVVAFGLGTYADAHNEPVVNMKVQNFSTSTSAEAVQINYVLNGRLRFIADVAGAGIGMQVNQANFNTFEGSYSAIGANSISVNFGAGTNTGNVFLSLDMENCAYCVAIPSGSSNTIGNTFIGGTYSYTANGLSISDGSDNSCLHPGINPAGSATVADFLAGGIGMTIKTTRAIGQFTPTMPASTTVVTNNYGATVQVSIWGGTVTVVTVNGYDIGRTGGDFILNSGDTIAITYSSVPTWYWKAIN